MRRRRKVDVFNDPELLELLGDDPELLAIADAVAQTQHPERSRPAHSRLLLAAAILVLTGLIAVPALAAFTYLIDFGSSPKAPANTIIDFASLDREAPANMAPNVIANETRRLEIPFGDTGRTATIYLAPTRNGGFCLQIKTPAAAGCDTNREIPFDLGISYTDASRPGVVYGTTLDTNADSAHITAADGTDTTIPLTHVSAPISAALFIHPIAPEHAALPATVELLDANGNIITTKTIKPFPEP